MALLPHAETVTSSTSANTERVAIILGLFTLVGTITTAIITVLGNKIAKQANANAAEAKQHAAEANDAVNHRHPGQPRLFDTVNRVQDQMNTLHRSVVNMQEQHQEQHQEVMSQVSEVRQELRDHVEWEMHQKYWDGVTERRKSQLPYAGPNRRITPEESP